MEEKTIGEEGEICIKTDTVMSGYFNNESESEKVIKVHEDGSVWVHTGDIGKLNRNGNLFVIGRIKRIIVSNGSKIFPTSIENIINKCPDIQKCVVVGGKHKSLRNVPIAHVILKNKDIDLSELTNILDEKIRKALPEFYLPSIYVFRDDIPVTSINKVDYKSLEEEMYSYQKKIVIKSDNDVKKKIKKL